MDVSASACVRNGCAVRPANVRNPPFGGNGICGEEGLIACVNLVVERDEYPVNKNAGPALPEKAREAQLRARGRVARSPPVLAPWVSVGNHIALARQDPNHRQR